MHAMALTSLGLVAALGFLQGVTLAAPPPVPATPVRVMVVGDSISEGTYRGYMFNELESRGYIGGTGPGAHFQMVGQRYWNDTGGTATNPWPTKPWDRGEGHGGFATEQILSGRWGETDNHNRGVITARATGRWDYFGGAPDIVTILLGTNDLSYYIKGRAAYSENKTSSQYYPFYKSCLDNYPTPAAGLSGPNLYAQTTDDLRSLVAWFQSINPTTTILLSTGIPTLNPDKNVASDYNLTGLKDQIVALVNGGTLNTGQSQVYLVDLWTGFDTAANFDYDVVTRIGDPTHPNDAGHRFIGARFADAVATALAVPEPSSLGLLALGAAVMCWRRRG